MIKRSDKTILVIDDESIVRDTVTAYLEDSGFNVIEANDGISGLELFHTLSPDLVLCDLKMPKVSGIDVLKQVVTENKETPFIVLSGAGVMADVVSALKLGASDYLFKPISDLAVLEHSILNNLERASLEAKLVQQRAELEETHLQLKQELDSGRMIQALMLPDNKISFGCWSFDYCLQPSHFLSGDLVDYFSLTDQEVFFYIVDVSGHGVSSALVTMIIKNYIDVAVQGKRFQIADSMIDLALLMKGLNQHLLDKLVERHATIFAGLLNIESDELYYCNAAHFPTAILVKEDGVEILEIEGKPVGLFENAEYQNRQIQLSDYKGFFLCSDGLMEILEPPEILEKERVIQNKVFESENNIEALIQSFGLNNVIDVPDDITMLTVNRNR